MARGIVFDSGRFHWNIHQNVGPGCPNNPEDVHLVQLGYAGMAASTKNPQPAEDKAVYAAVVVGAPYSGALDRTHPSVLSADALLLMALDRRAH